MKIVSILFLLIISSGNYSIAQNDSFYLKRGIERMEKQNDPKGAIVDFSAEIKKNPNSAIAYGYRADAKSSINDYLGAITDYGTALRLDSDNEMWYIMRGVCHSMIGKYAESLIDFNKLLIINPSNSMGLYYRAVTNRQLKHYKNAISDFTSAIRVNPVDFKSYEGRGTTYYMTYNFTLAIKDYNDALALNDNLSTTYYMRGASYYNINLKEKGCNDVKIAIEKGSVNAIKYFEKNCKEFENITDPESTIGRGMYRFQRLQDYKGAIEDCTNEIQRDPKSQSGYLYRGMAKFQLEDFAGAISDYKQLIKIVPNQESAHVQLAVCYATIERNDEAISVLDNILTFNSKSRDAYYYRGIINMSGNLSQAIDDFTNAIAIDHTDADSYHSRGRCKLLMENYKSALLDYNIAITLDPNRPMAYLQRGNIKMVLEDDEGACKDFKKADDLGASEGGQLAESLCK
jgi:tetratricopeptide (TPR) repeat protein